MESINDGASINIEEDEDRISNLPNNIIHHILSFIDMKYAVQTCTLSRKWENIWTTMPILKFNSQTFRNMRQFAKFVEHIFYHRNNHIEVSMVELTFTGATNQLVVEDIVNYAYLRNVRKMTLDWYTGIIHEIPQHIFSSNSLKHLTLGNSAYFTSQNRIPNSAFDFPVLETLNLRCIRLGFGSDKSLDLLSKCVNLKDLTLHHCSMYGLESFSVSAPRLSNLTITDPSSYPIVLNVVAPQLKTLSASVNSHSGGLISCFNFLRISTDCFTSLEKVNLSSSNGNYKKENLVPRLLNLFHVFRSAKFIILDVDIIKCLSLCLDQHLLEPCPFDNLKCMKINAERLKENDLIPTLPTQVKNYFLENSPSAAFSMYLSETKAKFEAEKKVLETMAEENRMLKEKMQNRDQQILYLKSKLFVNDHLIADQKADILWNDHVIAEKRAMIEMLKLNKDAIQSYVPARFLVPRPSSWNVPHKRSREQVPNDTMPKKVAKLAAEEKQSETMAEENRMLEGKIQMQDQVIANLKKKLQMSDQAIANQKEDIQMKKQVIAKQKDKIEFLKSHNIHKQSNVPAPFPVSRPSSWNVPHMISRQHIPTDIMPKNVAKSRAEKKLPKTVAEDYGMLGANIQSPDQVIANLKRKLQMKDQVIDNQNVNIQMKDKVIAKLNADIQMLKSDKIPMQTYVPGPPPVPRPSSSNKTASSRHEAVGSFNLHKLSE